MARFWYVRLTLPFLQFELTEQVREGLDQVTNRYRNKRVRYAQNSRSTFEWTINLNWTRAQRISLFFQEVADRKRQIYRRPYRGKSKRYKPIELLFD